MHLTSRSCGERTARLAWSAQDHCRTQHAPTYSSPKRDALLDAICRTSPLRAGGGQNNSHTIRPLHSERKGFQRDVSTRRGIGDCHPARRGGTCRPDKKTQEVSRDYAVTINLRLDNREKAFERRSISRPQTRLQLDKGGSAAHMGGEPSVPHQRPSGTAGTWNFPSHQCAGLGFHTLNRPPPGPGHWPDWTRPVQAKASGGGQSKIQLLVSLAPGPG